MEELIASVKSELENDAEKLNVEEKLRENGDEH